MSKIYVVFRNKKIIAVASSFDKAEDLVTEYQFAEGCIKNVSFKIVEVEDAEYIHNL